MHTGGGHYHATGKFLALLCTSIGKNAYEPLCVRVRMRTVFEDD